MLYSDSNERLLDPFLPMNFPISEWGILMVVSWICTLLSSVSAELDSFAYEIGMVLIVDDEGTVVENELSGTRNVNTRGTRRVDDEDEIGIGI